MASGGSGDGDWEKNPETAPKKSYDRTECTLGECKEPSPKIPKSPCENEDDLTLSIKNIPNARGCNDEDRKQCRADQVCELGEQGVTCKCAEQEHEVGGACTGVCKENDCYKNFTDCTVHCGQQRCSCPWKSRKPIGKSDKCILSEYYYTVSFKMNKSLEANDCTAYERQVLDAIRTTLGPEIYKVEILSCKDNITARLITEKPLKKYLVEMLKTCQYSDGSFCFFYPLLRIEKGSATEIQEENLCETLLKTQESAYKGANKCVREGSLFWFKCESGYREVYQKTLGRLRRSVCEPKISCPPEQELWCHLDGRICVYENDKAECKCPKGTIEDNGECTGRTTCNPAEVQECQGKGRECVYKELTTQCLCPIGMVEMGEHCTVPPRACTQEDREECEKKGEECFVDNDKVVCKTKEVSATTTAASPALGICTKEKNQECGMRDEECIVQNNKAACRKKEDSTAAAKASLGAESFTATEASPDLQGSGSSTIFASAINLLSILIFALLA
ncbi:glycoprotein antigen BM86-like [Amblyomma americanum]